MNTSNAGVFALNLNNVRTNSDVNRGFRSALLSWSDDELLRWFVQYRENKGIQSRAVKQKIY